MPFVSPVLPNRPDADPVKDIAMAWLTGDGRARLVVGDGLSILWINEVARALLAIDPAVAIHGNALGFANAAMAQEFSSHLCASGDERLIRSISFVRGAGHYVVNVTPADVTGGRLWLFEIVVDHHKQQLKYADFDRLFALTAAERDTALAMAEGLAPVEIALRRHVSIDTVRSHVRGVYVKLGVASREQFFRRMAGFRVV